MSAALKVATGGERGEILESAKRFKSNWVELGEQLARVVDQRLFEQWGFATFDDYVSKELKLRKETAHKLVRSFTFVRTARPQALESGTVPSMDVVDFIQKKREAEALPEPELQAFTEQAFEKNWTPRTVSQKWRDLVSPPPSEEATPVAAEDKSTRAVRKAKDLAARLQQALTEIPGLDTAAIDAAQKIVAVLDQAA